MTGSGLAAGAGLLAALAVAAPGAAARGDAARGRLIYVEGRRADGEPVRARVAGGIEVPATAQPCARCHGEDGRGGREGGVRIPDVRWARLGAPYGVRGALGRWRPAYDAGTLARALRDGVDSAGRPLDPLMPRFDLSDRDVADLIAHLRAFGAEAAPGVTAEEVRIAAFLPLSGPRAAQGAAVRAVLEGAFARLNAAGGIHGRRVVLIALDAAGAVPGPAAAIEALLDEPPGILAFVANAGPGAAPASLSALDARGVPVVAPLAAAEADPGRGSVFYLLDGPRHHACAAVAGLARDGPGRRVALAGPSGRSTVRATLREQAARRGLEVVADEDVPGAADAAAFDDLVRRLRRRRVDHLIWAGDAAGARRLVHAVRRAGWRPGLTAFSVLLGGPMRARGLDLRIVAPPVTPDRDHPAWRAFEDLAGDGDPRHVGLQMTAFAATRVLFEALKATGRDLRRRDLVAALEALRGFRTGVTPPLTFGPNRRLGQRAALVVTTGAGGRRRVELVDGTCAPGRGHGDTAPDP